VTSAKHCGGMMLFALISSLSASVAEARSFRQFLEGEQESFLVFPRYAVREPAGWRVPLTVWVFEPETASTKRHITKRLIARALDIERGSASYSIFQKRADWFLVDNERNKRVVVQAGTLRISSPKTSANGFASYEILVPAKAGQLEQGHLLVRASLGKRLQNVRVPLAKASQLAVISDVDDTIKQTNVLDRSEMLQNTFARPFRAVPGMAKRYRRWAESRRQFHYLSASPYNLYVELERFLQAKGFPSGVLHLRKLRLRPTELHRFASSSRPYKLATIRSILRRFPRTRFILVGDSGEKDPEIYGEVARKHPKQVEAVYIRRVEGADNSKKRFRRALKGVETWRVFSEAQQVGTHQ
jgi:phosphatidate phosphatase APP1